MNQDSEQNDRDFGSNRNGNRSVGRRDDAPRFNRSQDGDRPRFNRDDKPRSNRDHSEKPVPRDNNRGNRDENRFSDRRSDSKPRFNREDKPRFERGNRDEFSDRRPRFDRDSNERPAFKSRDDKPSFGNNRPDRREGELGNRRFNDRSGDSGERKPNVNRDENRNRPSHVERNTDRFGSERRFRDESDNKPRFRRDDSNEERPRFNREDKPRFGGPRDGERRESRPAWRNEKDRSGDGDRPKNGRFSDRSNNDRPGFRRDRGDRPFRDEKPQFKRAGDFNRDEQDRPKNRLRDDESRDKKPRASNKEAWNRDDETSRFSGQQRKESGERRTGKYTKAPNYDLEQARQNTSFRRERPAKTRGEHSDEKPKRKAAEPTDGPGLTRLNRYIANSGVCSRREADELIARGDISVNGKVVTEMGYKVKDGDTVKYGTKVLNPERFVYVLLNKPKDYITTTDDPEERRTVMELVADAGNFRMYPVGRLDRNTTGLLLLTNDGELADKLTHPSNNIRKIYQVEIDKPITDEHFEAIKKGLDLEDGPIKPDALSIVTPDAQVVGIEIHSGRNRIVRRLFEHFGYEVTKLDRTTYAGLTKKELPRGKWRFLDPKEVVKLKYFN
ncbi:pseudouridine synthase [Spirosoma harenae]